MIGKAGKEMKAHSPIMYNKKLLGGVYVSKEIN